MSDENTTIDSGVNGRTIYNVVVSAGKTYIINAVTGRTEFVVNGEFTPGGDSAVATSLTTAERTAITPDAGVLIWDTDLEKLFVGDGSTAGGVEVQGGGGEGTVTGIEASVTGNTATITATGSTTSVDIVGTGGVDVKGNTNGAVELDAKDLSDGTQSVSKDLENARYIIAGSSPKTNSLTLLHFSDIHADSAALNRIMEDRTEFGTLVNDVICTGDMVEIFAGQISSWWNPAVLTCIGNHECYTNGDWNGLSMANRIAYYISPFESNWGITRGENQDWWYKDYATQKVRLISIDCLWYRNPTGTEATTQTAWVQSLLADAITQGLHVLIASHSRNNASIQCYTSFNRFGEYDGYITTICETPQVIIDAVASAINSGLKFIGYITGHYHQDDIWDATGDGTQYVYAVTLASTAAIRNISDQYRVGMDAYNLVTIDTNNTLVKLTRGGGANIDNTLRPRQTITVNYSTGEIIDVERARDGERLETKDGVQNVKRYIATKSVSGSSVTLQAGYGYKGTITSELTLETEYVSGSQYGLESVLDLTLAGGTVSAGTNVILGDALESGMRNICSVKFIDSLAVVNVLTAFSMVPVGAYLVVSDSGTSDGSLYYGLATSMKSDLYFDTSLNYQTIDLGGAVTNGDKSVVGNGYGKTIISGNISGTSETTFTALSMNGVTMLGGVMTMSGVNIPTGGSVNVNGGQVQPQKVDGSGTINLDSYAGSVFPIVAHDGAVVNNVTITGALNNDPFRASGTNIQLSGVIISGNTRTAWTSGNYEQGYAQNGGSALLTGCTFCNNYGAHAYANGGGAHVFGSGNATFSNCLFASNYAQEGGGGVAGNLAGATISFISCVFSDNTMKNEVMNGGGHVSIYATDGVSGVADFTDCSFIGGSAWNGVIFCKNNAELYMSNCTISGAIGVNAAIVQNAGKAIRLEGCTITGCTCSATSGTLVQTYTSCTVDIVGCTVTGNSAGYNDMLFASNTVATFSNTIMSGNVNTYGLGAKQGARIILAGGNTLDRIVPYNTGSVYIAGSNNVNEIYTTTGTNHVYISSGASINLTTSIGIGANGITVSSGGCVVNGATIAAGTYTTIVSSGGSAVAS